jgi:large subunit ribosomal protein L9
MKLILQQEVAGLGSAGDVVEVKDGYGRNYLIPRGAAIRWSRGAEKQIESIKKARSAREIRDLDTAESVQRQLESLTVQLQVRAGESGRLFGAVTPADIATAVRSSGGPDVDKRRIEVGNPIKTLGVHEVAIRLHDEVAAKVTVNVIPA